MLNLSKNSNWGYHLNALNPNFMIIQKFMSKNFCEYLIIDYLLNNEN